MLLNLYLHFKHLSCAVDCEVGGAKREGTTAVSSSQESPRTMSREHSPPASAGIYDISKIHAYTYTHATIHMHILIKHAYTYMHVYVFIYTCVYTYRHMRRYIHKDRLLFCDRVLCSPD